MAEIPASKEEALQKLRMELKTISLDLERLENETRLELDSLRADEVKKTLVGE